MKIEYLQLESGNMRKKKKKPKFLKIPLILFILLVIGFGISKLNFEEENTEKEIEYVKERLMYYVESLPKLTVYGDEYKYYFHNNIVVHEYVKLKAFLNGVFEYSYLPKNAKKYLKEEEWEKILFNFGDDQIKHYENVKKMSLDLIQEIIEKYIN